MDPFAHPRLRPDVEFAAGRPEEPEQALLYDPAQRDLFELEAQDLALLRLLDGSRTPQEVARQAGRPLDQVWDLLDDLSDVLLLEDPEQEDLLEALRCQHEEEDLLLQPVLDSRPAPDLAGLPVLVVDEAGHTCRRCGACCHYAVPVSPQERHRLEQVEWPEEIIPPEAGRLFQVRPGTQWGRLEGTIATRSGPTRCAFLDEEMLCRVQACLGAAAKPFACRLFPLAFPVLTAAGLLFSLTFECPYLFQTYGTGERLARRPEELRALAAEMEELYTLPAEIALDGERSWELARYLAWEEGIPGEMAAAATRPAAALEALQRHWATTSALPGPLPTADESARLARFVQHFIAGKQHLLYPSLWLGLRALAALLLLARIDAAMMEREAGRAEAAPEALNRALARWCRLLDVRPFRLAFLQAAGRPA